MGGFFSQIVVPVIGVLGLVVVIGIFAVLLCGSMEWLDTAMERAKRRRRGEVVRPRERWAVWKRAFNDFRRHPYEGQGSGAGPGLGLGL
ncbi:hypothetical protein [Nocardia sp. NPDC050406]|uniref:hypothetical protein n=1 Tax=Nocardia sp. NPDC050406 TaxID=3364318 RepID=UPI0037A243F2